MGVAVKFVASDLELERVSTVLLQLRNAFEKVRLIAQIKEQQKHGYQVVYIEQGETVQAVAGFVVSTKLAWGKHMYIDDFVTNETQRRSGFGARLMEWLKAYALEQGCHQIHLDSNVTNFLAHTFYLSQGFNIASHHFSIKGLERPSR